MRRAITCRRNARSRGPASSPVSARRRERISSRVNGPVQPAASAPCREASAERQRARKCEPRKACARASGNDLRLEGSVMAGARVRRRDCFEAAGRVARSPKVTMSCPGPQAAANHTLPRGQHQKAAILSASHADHPRRRAGPRLRLRRHRAALRGAAPCGRLQGRARRVPGEGLRDDGVDPRAARRLGGAQAAPVPFRRALFRSPRQAGAPARGGRGEPVVVVAAGGRYPPFRDRCLPAGHRPAARQGRARLPRGPAAQPAGRGRWRVARLAACPAALAHPRGLACLEGRAWRRPGGPPCEGRVLHAQAQGRAPDRAFRGASGGPVRSDRGARGAAGGKGRPGHQGGRRTLCQHPARRYPRLAPAPADPQRPAQRRRRHSRMDHVRARRHQGRDGGPEPCRGHRAVARRPAAADAALAGRAARLPGPAGRLRVQHARPQVPLRRGQPGAAGRLPHFACARQGHRDRGTEGACNRPEDRHRADGLFPAAAGVQGRRAAIRPARPAQGSRPRVARREPHEGHDIQARSRFRGPGPERGGPLPGRVRPERHDPERELARQCGDRVEGPGLRRAARVPRAAGLLRHWTPRRPGRRQAAALRSSLRALPSRTPTSPATHPRSSARSRSRRRNRSAGSTSTGASRARTSPRSPTTCPTGSTRRAPGSTARSLPAAPRTRASRRRATCGISRSRAARRASSWCRAGSPRARSSTCPTGLRSTGSRAISNSRAIACRSVPTTGSSSPAGFRARWPWSRTSARSRPASTFTAWSIRPAPTACASSRKARSPRAQAVSRVS